MAINLGAVFLNAAVSQVVGSVVGNFFGRIGGQGERTLETFLAALSTDFTNRVEGIVRNAFDQQNLLEIKSDLRTSATAFRTFRTSNEEDLSQLELASEKVLEARSRLITTCEQILENPFKGSADIHDPVEKALFIKTRLKVLEASMGALQVVAALDFLILAKKTEQFPRLSSELRLRSEEYIELAKKLKNSYTISQTLRAAVIFSHSQGIGFGGDRPCYVQHFKGQLYVDGVLTIGEEKDEAHRSIPPERVKVLQQGFERMFQDLCRKAGKDFQEAAKIKMAENGNIEEAVRVWEAVRDSFPLEA